MKRILGLALTFAVALSGSSALASTPRVAQQSNGSISGTANSNEGQPLPNVTVQLRDLATGQIVSTQQTTAAGAYAFMNLPAGNYAVEAVNPGGQVIGTSASITLRAGQALSGVVLQANAGLLNAGGAGGAAAGGSAGAGKGVAAAVLIAVAAGTALIGAQTNSSTSASPSR